MPAAGAVAAMKPPPPIRKKRRAGHPAAGAEVLPRPGRAVDALPAASELTSYSVIRVRSTSDRAERRAAQPSTAVPQVATAGRGDHG